MGLIDSIVRLWKAPETVETPEIDCRPAPKPQRSLLDLRPDVDGDDIALGVKFASKYSWHILPPAGWRRQESISGPAWPMAGSSPSVTFLAPGLSPPEQALIKWHLLSVPESASSHSLLEELLYGTRTLTPEAVRGLEAPGLVTGTKVHKVERVDLGGSQPALLVAARIEQLKGEPPILRYVLVLPDRPLDADGQRRHYRESLQYAATEDSFYANEATAVESLKSFRRTAEVQTISGAFAAFSQGAPSTVR